MTVVLSGHEFELRPVELDHVTEEGWTRWYNDPVITRYNGHGNVPISLEQEREIVAETMADPRALLLGIWTRADNRLIGNICLQSIDAGAGAANIAITIGESGPMSAATEAFGLLTHHAFIQLKLLRLADATHERLETLMHMIAILGYRIEGIGRGHFRTGPEQYDLLYFGCRSEDYVAELDRRNGHVLFPDSTSLKREIMKAVRARAAGDVEAIRGVLGFHRDR